MEQLQNGQVVQEVEVAMNVEENDEIDKLFMKLEPVMPPASLVHDIMAAVADLPLPLSTLAQEG
jgi:hypothetical protein